MFNKDTKKRPLFIPGKIEKIVPPDPSDPVQSIPKLHLTAKFIQFIDINNIVYEFGWDSYYLIMVITMDQLMNELHPDIEGFFIKYITEPKKED